MTLDVYISSGLMIFQLIVQLVILLYSIRLKRIHPVLKLMYILWMLSFFASNLYYLIHELQNKGMYLPLSVMEIVNLGIYMLLPFGLEYNFLFKINEPTKIGIAGAIFGALNVALWILWSGSWLGNLLNAPSFMFLMFVCARSLEESNAVTKLEWIFFFVAAVIVCAGNTVLCYIDEPLYTVIDTLTYIILFAFTLYIFFKTVDAISRGYADKALALSLSAYAMSLVSMYLSYEPLYYIADFELTISMILTCLAIRKKEREAAES